MNEARVLESLICAAHCGGDVLRHSFGRQLVVEEHAHPGDVTTSADMESLRAVLCVVERELPAFSIVAEDFDPLERGSDYVVVVDPLDGSNNFLLGVPYFAVSVALMRGDEVVMGVVHQPVIERTYHAVKGKGAFRDGVRIQVSQCSRVEQATVSYVCGYGCLGTLHERIDHEMCAAGVKRQIRFWSPASDLCLLASGKIEGVINSGNKLYDFASGKLIVREAGGEITDWFGGPETDENPAFVASNGTSMHRALLRFVHAGYA